MHPKIATIAGEPFEYHLTDTSQGTQYTLILMNGFRIPMNSWANLFPGIEQYGRVLAYNRRGVGNTAKAQCPQTADQVIEDLRNLLTALCLSPPYVLLPHSVGGIFANYFARQYPQEICAAVFVEAAHPDEKAEQAIYPPPLPLRLLTIGLKKLDLLFDKYQHSEDDAMAQSIAQLENAGPFPDVPLSIISGGRKMPMQPQGSFQAHQRAQQKLLALSAQSEHCLAQRSGHFPHLTEPDFVLKVIGRTLAKISPEARYSASLAKTC